MRVPSQLGAPLPRRVAVAVDDFVRDFWPLPKLVGVEKRAHDDGVEGAEDQATREDGGE